VIHSHLLILVIFAALVSTVFALIQRDEPKDRLRFGLITFGAFVLSVLVVGWLMYPFPD
jgi:hypothetical protein